jgi:23S rRNA G2445 N2-methylase RlmL
MFATCVPGLGPLVRRQLDELPGVSTTGAGFDGRADIVLFEAERDQRGATLELRTAEDVFVEVSRALRSDGDSPRPIAGRIWQPQRVQRALSIWAEEVRPLTASMTFRVIARVLTEKAFLRTDLRQQLDQAVRADRPRWRFADPARLEVWVSEYAAGRFVAGLRLSDAEMRQHGGRDTERRGALRPTVAAAMVQLAGPAGGTLLDPCCGAGTILAEARAAGWAAHGSDIDPGAVEIARRNVPGAQLRAGDARRLALPDGAAGACVSNLPFGRQYEVQGHSDGWLSAVLGEMARVTRPGGFVVLLAPAIARNAAPDSLRLRQRIPIRLLGTRTTIWAYHRG